MFKVTVAAIVAMIIVCATAMMVKANNLPGSGQVRFLQSQGLSFAEAQDYRASSIAIINKYSGQLRDQRAARGKTVDSGSFVRDISDIVAGITRTHLSNSDAHQRYELIKQARPYAPSTEFANMAQMALNFMQGLPSHHGLITNITSGNFSGLIDFGF